MSPASKAALAPGRILIVCTGNICRSPYVERLLASQLADLGITVESAGSGALVGSEMHREVQQRLRAQGLDPTGFAARQLTGEMVHEADLVLTATREHRRAVVEAEPKGLRYTFALADFADLVDPGQHPVGAEGRSSSLVTHVMRSVSARRGLVQPRSDSDAGIVDPFRQSTQVFDRMEAQISELVPTVVRAFHTLADRRQS